MAFLVAEQLVHAIEGGVLLACLVIHDAYVAISQRVYAVGLTSDSDASPIAQRKVVQNILLEAYERETRVVDVVGYNAVVDIFGNNLLDKQQVARKILCLEALVLEEFSTDGLLYGALDAIPFKKLFQPLGGVVYAFKGFVEVLHGRVEYGSEHLVVDTLVNLLYGADFGNG